MSDLYSQVQEIDDRVQELENISISSDMGYDTMNNLVTYMQGNFWNYGQVAMGGGTSVSVTIPGVNSGSIALLTSSNTGFRYGYTCSQDTLTISSSGASTEIITYLVILTP